MKLICIPVLLVLCTASQAITFSTVATVSLTLISLNKPVSCFFGIFRRRKSPVQETAAASQAESNFFPSLPVSGGMFNPFGGFGAGGLFFPGMNNPGFGMFGNRFPPQFRPPVPAQAPQPIHQGNTQHRFPPQAVQNFPPQAVQGFPQQQAMQHFSPQQQQAMQFPPQQMPPHGLPPNMNGFEDPNEGEDDIPGMNTEEAESFFTLLSETDESKCISRLVCEMGSNPESGGQFGQTIVEIIGSLKDFPDGSKVSEYNEILSIGLAEGLPACRSKFSVCDEESFQLVKKSQLEDEQDN